MKNIYFFVLIILLKLSNSSASFATQDQNDYVLLSANTLALATPIVTMGAGVTAYVYRHTLMKKISACGSCLSDCCGHCCASSKKKDIKQVLCSNMEKTYLELIKDIDRTLGRSKKQDNQEWYKFPIYGNFGHNYKIPFIHYLICYHQEDKFYLYGYLYENKDENYTIEIRRHFSTKPLDDVSLSSFKEINPLLKSYDRGIEEEPIYSPCKDIILNEDEEAGIVQAHPHLNLENFANVDLSDVELFLKDFFESGSFLRKNFPSRSIKVNPFTSLLKLYEEDSPIQIAAVDEVADKKEKKRFRHLYFLLPTVQKGKEDEEQYKIMLHVQELVKDYSSYRGIIPDGTQFFPRTNNCELHLRLAEVEDKNDSYDFIEAIGIKKQEILEFLRGQADTRFIKYWVAQDIFKFFKDGSLFEQLAEMFNALKERKQELLTILETNFGEHAEFVLANLKKQETAFLEPHGTLDENLQAQNITTLADNFQGSSLSKRKRKEVINIEKQLFQINYEIFQRAQENDTYLQFIGDFEEDLYPLSKTSGLYRAIAHHMGSNIYIWQINNLHLKLIEWCEINKEDAENFSDVRNIHLLYNRNGTYDKLSDIISEEFQISRDEKAIKNRVNNKEGEEKKKKHKEKDREEKKGK